ncbi:helix-turn-helix domain-containing protein [Alteribacillus sp. JSM 102045]|uniref:helix-turn-helix domain-containing protein n=1 Tax=Alteribacillus sp. JSM 102045 TaxID=1562101 RepID=UPI0035C20158
MKKKQSLKSRVEAVEKQLILDALKKSLTMSEAAKELKVNASTLSRECQKYKITVRKTVNLYEK